MKKLTAVITAIIACMSMFSCGKSGEKGKQPKNTIADELLDVAYKKSVIEAPDELKLLYCLEPYNGGEDFLILGWGGSGVVFYTVKNDFTGFTKLEIPDFEVSNAYSIDVCDDGTIVQVLNRVDYGDLPEPDINSEDYDEELYDAAAEYTLTVNRYSIEGELLSSSPIEDLPVSAEKNTSVSAVVTDGEAIIANIDTSYYVLDSDGKFIGELDSGSQKTNLMSVGKDRDQNLVCAVVDFEKDELQICGIDTEKAAPKKSDITYTFTDTITGTICEGTGDYSLFFPTRTMIYGIRSDDSSIEPLFNVSASGIDIYAMTNYYIDPDGTFVIPDNKNYTSLTIRRYTECDPAELEGIPVVTVGVVGAPIYVQDQMNVINDSQSDYRVVLKTYNDDEAQSDSFEQDVLSGDVPDVLVLDKDLNFGNINMYKKDALCDLYEFIDTDNEISREDFIENIMTGFEVSGALYAMPSRFLIDAGYAVKSKYAADIDKWDLSTYIGMLENMPEGMVKDKYSMDGDTKYIRFSYNPYDFIDFEKGTCNFDCSEFIRLLNYCNEAPLEDAESEYDFGSMSDSELEAYFAVQDRALIDDKAMFSEVSVGCYYRLQNMREGEFGGEEMTLLGRPTIDGKNHFVVDQNTIMEEYGITKTSKNKEYAWEFVKSFVSDEYYEQELDPGMFVWGFPMTRSGLDIKAEAEMIQYGKEKGSEMSWHYGDNSIEIGYLTQEDIDETKEMIYSVNGSNPIDYIGVHYTNVVWEEADKFFHGECTAEQCAAAIQNRLSIMLAEQY